MLAGALCVTMGIMKMLPKVLAIAIVASSVKPALPQPATGFSFAGTLRLIEDSGTRDLGDIGLALTIKRSRFQRRLATANPYNRAIINRHFDDLIDLAFEKNRVYETYSGGVRAQHKMRLANWARNIRSSIRMADAALWNLDLGGTPPAKPRPAPPLVFRYPQQPTLEPSWRRAQRAERAQLGSVGSKARSSGAIQKPGPPPARRKSPVKTAAPEEAEGGVPASVRSLAAVSSSDLSPGEKEYISLVDEFIAITNETRLDISTPPARDLATALTATHARLNELWRKYLQLPAIKRFAEVDVYVRQGMVNEMTAFEFASKGARTGYWGTWKMARVPHQEGQALLAQSRALLPPLSRGEK